MTTQTAIFDGLPTGLTLTGKIFDVDTPDTEVTGNTFGIVEGTNALSRYVVTITRATALPAGDYDIRLFVGSVPFAVGTFRFAGTDGETATEVPVTVELDPAARVKLDANQPDYVPATAISLAAAKAILDKIDTGLVQDGLVYQFTANMLELGPSGSGGSSDWTADERTAIRAILGIPGSGTTPTDPTTGILDEIRDRVVAYIATALATVNGTSGTIVDFPSSLNIGDSYTEEANSDIHVFIRDENDDPIIAVGDFNFTDPEFAPEVNITQSGSTGRVKAVVTFVDASPEGYLKVEIPSSQSRRASPGTATIQCLLKWVDTDGKILAQKSLSKQAVTWNEMI